VLTYRNQSTAISKEMFSIGSPTEVSTKIIVTNPTPGTDAAPIDTTVAVKLKN